MRVFGRYRGGLLFAQALIILGLVGMPTLEPRLAFNAIVWYALLVAFRSATKDIALDAFRIGSTNSDHQAALAATRQTWAGAGVLWLAARAETGSGYDASVWNLLTSVWPPLSALV